MRGNGRAVTTRRHVMPTLAIARNGLAAAIAAKRVERELSIRSAAEEAGLDYGTIFRLETKDHYPSFEAFIAISKWLGLSLDEAADLRMKKTR